MGIPGGVVLHSSRELLCAGVRIFWHQPEVAFGAEVLFAMLPYWIIFLYCLRCAERKLQLAGISRTFVSLHAQRLVVCGFLPGIDVAIASSKQSGSGDDRQTAIA